MTEGSNVAKAEARASVTFEEVIPEDAGWRRFLRDLLAVRLAGVGIAIIALFILCAAFASKVAPYDPLRQNLDQAFSPPSFQHLFGTDDLGRDLLSRTIYGARISLLAGAISVSIALVLGVAVGLVAGYWSKPLDLILMRLMDALLAFPSLILALAITAMLGSNLVNALIAIGVVGIPAFARLTRGQVLAVREYAFVEAGRALGASDIRIMIRHILPNVSAALIVQASLSVAFAILAEASLSFLGLGAKPPTPSWGSMVSLGRDFLDQAPWIVFAPGGAIFLAVLGFNFLGDALRDLLDPRVRHSDPYTNRFDMARES
jgi:peptide/nickel transport system permease protein